MRSRLKGNFVNLGGRSRLRTISLSCQLVMLVEYQQKITFDHDDNVVELYQRLAVADSSKHPYIPRLQFDALSM